DEASSASHASSSRLTSSMNTISSGSQSKIQYQPLSMADALARTGHDQVLALDQLLAERNKLCLEANKLSTENMRLWNMMKRIRRENEELKNNNTGTLRSSPLSNGSQVAGSNNAFPSTTDPSGNQLESQKSSLYGSAPSGTGHSISGEGSEPRGSFTSNEVQEQQSPSNIPATTSTATVHPDTASTTGPLNKSDTQGIGISTDSELANNQSSDSASHSQQHQSIMQQRAAAQAQRLAQIQSQKADDGARPSSTGSHDFDAVDASSMAGSEGARNSMRFSGDSGNNRGLQARVVPPSPLAISSPTMQSTSSGRQWSTESPRNSFSPRLDAGLLPFVNLSVSGSNLRASERGKEIVSFYIAIDVKPPQGRVPQYSSWRVEKTYSDVLNLDARIKQKHGKVVSKRMSGVQLPDQTLFKDHAPSKVDKRKAMLELYLRTLVTIPLPDKDDLCTFFCTDALQPKIREPDALTKEGFLTKKGQNLGRWVTRWYVLSETSLDHYEWRNGLHLGSINIRGAQIGRQQKSVATDTDENSYRHAFLILETKAPSSTGDQKQIIRHVLCAETDEERDDWVEVLVRAIGEADNREEENLNTTAVIPKSPSALPSTTQRPSREYSPFAAAAAAPNSPHGVSPQISMPRSRSEVVGLQSSQEERSMRTRHANLAAITASPGQNTQSGQGYQSGNRNTINPGSPIRPPPRSTSQDVPSNGYGMVTSSSNRARPSISGPMNGTPIPTGYKFGGKDEPSETPSNKPSGPVSSSKNDGPNAPNETKRRFWHRFGGGGDKSNQQRKVFGVPLAESIAVSNVSEGLELPSVVYRCIEYLEHHNAASEEGIYRLSGSSAVIKNLKDRFNAQGDVNLLASNEPFFDPHAIAGLLKQYLRELPSSVLTRELHLDFMRVNDLADRRERVNELGSLVSLLPLPNYSLLRTLCSHLIKVIERSDVNKMTMRNVGIVFSPTLGIPAGVFALFLTEFDWVFYTDAKGEPAPRTMEEDILPPDEDELGLANKTDGSPQGQQRQPHHQRNAGSFEDDFARK
ncbi:RhoGAP-domain-containing protein, partial [Meira miltonrushii]